MTDDNPDTDAAEELLQKSKSNKRHQTDPSTNSKETRDLADAVADAYAADISENLTIRDGNLAALFAGLEETGELETVSTPLPRTSTVKPTARAKRRRSGYSSASRSVR